MLGSNPIAIAMPAEPYDFFFDASTTVVTRGKLEIYNKLGKPLPDMWALGADGKRSSDASDVLKNIVAKAEGEARIYTHGEKEVFAYKDRLENGIDVNIGTVAEMVDLCKYLDMDVKEYLGEEAANLVLKKSSYDM